MQRIKYGTRPPIEREFRVYEPFIEEVQEEESYVYSHDLRANPEFLDKELLDE